MRQQQQLPTQDWQLLSAYLDDQLSANEQAKLEKRLREQSELRQALEELRTTRAMLRSAGKQRAPRNFTLSPAMVEKARPRPLLRLIPVLNFASAASALAVVILLVVGLLPGFVPAAVTAPAAAPQPNAIEDTTGSPAPLVWNQPAASGMGGGGGDVSAPEAMTAKNIGSGGGGGGGGPGFTLPPQAVENLPDQAISNAQPEPAPTQAAALLAPEMTATPASADTYAVPAPAQAAPVAPQPAVTEMAASQEEAPKTPLTGSGPILGVRPPEEARAENSQVISQPDSVQMAPATRSAWWIAPLALALVAAGAALASWIIRRKTAL